MSSPANSRKITIRLKTLFMDKDRKSLTTKTKRMVIVKGIICIRKKGKERLIYADLNLHQSLYPDREPLQNPDQACTPVENEGCQMSQAEREKKT
jgi:hypothetical protein